MTTDIINIEEASVKAMKEALSKLGVAFKAKAKAAELKELLMEALEREKLGVHPANDPLCEIFSDPKSGHPACQECLRDFGKRYDACVEAAEEKKKAKKAGKTGGPSTKVRGKYADFADLKSSLEAAPEKRLTMVVDKLLLEGHTMKEVLAEIEERKTQDFKDSNDFKSVAIIQKHIRYRASKGWVFTIFKNGKVKLTGYEQEPQTVNFTAPIDVPEEDEKKAA